MSNNSTPLTLFPRLYYYYYYYMYILNACITEYNKSVTFMIHMTYKAYCYFKTRIYNRYDSFTLIDFENNNLCGS